MSVSQYAYLVLREEDAAIRVVSRTSGDRMLLMTVGDAISGTASRIIQAAETSSRLAKNRMDWRELTAYDS